MDKAAFIQQTEIAKAALTARLAGLSAEQLNAPNALANGGSIKDLLAHITWYERQMLELLSSMDMAASSPHWLLPHDQRNQVIDAENQNKSLTEVQTEAEQVFNNLLTALHSMDEAALHTASRFANMPPDWTPWQMMAENTYFHYQEHITELENTAQGA